MAGRTPKKAPSAAQLRRLYEKERLSINEVARRLDVGRNLARQWLLEAGIATRAAQRTRPTPTQLRRFYVTEGQSLSAIAGRYGRSPATVKAWLAEADIPTRQTGRSSVVDARAAYAARLYELNKVPLKDIASRYDVDVATVRRWLADHGTPLRRSS